jgi:hypothetical protein
MLHPTVRFDGPHDAAEPHTVIGRPLIRIRGAWEYRARPSHLEDDWDRYRGRSTLAALVGAILRRTGA